MRALAFVLWALVILLLLLPALRRTVVVRARRPAPRPDELVKDPVCQTYVVRSRAVSRTDRGEVHYFCSAECARRYGADVRG